MSRAPGESRIPTVRRSALPRPTSAAAPSQLQLGTLPYAAGPPPLALSKTSPTYDTSREIIANPAHLQGGSLHHPRPSVPRLRLSSGRVGRLSDSELPDSAQSRRAQRQGPGGSRLGFQYNSGDIWAEEERVWGRESHEGLRGLKASTESAFSRQLAKITRGSNEDVSDPSLTYRISSIRGPRSCWDGSIHPVSGTESPAHHLSRECVGRRVVVGGAEHGTLRYFGRTAFASGEWCGVELERPVGKNDGSVDGVIYFTCHPGYGIFAPAGKVFLDLDYIGEDDTLPLNARSSGQSSVWQGLMPSSTHSQEANPARRRPSDASNATYTIEGRDSSLPTSPESQDSLQPREFAQTKRAPGHDEHEDDIASLGSPEDATCDESSLGILTPDQMPDFTVTASASLGRSPSDEDVAALEDEVCDASLPAEASGRGEVSTAAPLLRWDSDPCVTGVDEELFKNDVSAIIRELRTSAEVSSSGGSSPTRPHPSPETEQFQHDEEELEQQQKKEDEEEMKASLQKCNEHDEEVSKQDLEEEQCETIPELREISVGVDMSRLPSMARRVAPLTTRLLLATTAPGEVTPDAEAAWGGAAAAMTTSAGSLDQGYQGDAECDPRSEGGTGTASSPTEDVRLFQGVIDVERLTEVDVSLADDEGEGDHHGIVTARDRMARIIDGKLYHNHRELGRAHDPSTSEMDSSGFYSDLDPRDRDAEDESARTDLEPVQEALGNSTLHDSLLDDQSHAQDDNTHHDHSFDDHSLKDDLIDDKEGSCTIDDEDRSSASTLRPESKDLTLSEQQDHTQSPSDPKQGSASPANNSTSSCDSRVSSVTKNNKDGNSAPTIDSKLTDSGISVEGGEDVKAQQAPKPRTYDKPWLARPLPLKKKEETRKPLPPPPPMPKKNVQSKLKALLEAQEQTSEETRRPRQPRKNRWDEVMNKIAEGQKEDKVRSKVKEVKSRLMEGVMTQAQLSPQAERIRQERRERRERRERQAANAAVAARRASQARGDRKRSSASIRSNRTSRAPSLDSLPTDPARTCSRGSTPEHSEASHKSNVDKLATTTSRPVSPCPSDVSSSDQSRASNLSRVSSRLPIRALHVSGPARSGSITSLCSTASGGAGSRGSRDSRVLSTNRANITAGEKKRPEPTAPPRRPRLDNVKSTIPKPGRLPPRKLTDPVKAARPGGPTSGPRGPHVGHNGPGQQHPVPHADQLRRLEAEVAARAAELKAARAERDQFGRGVEALTILIHHLTNTYDPFTTPRLKAEVVRLNTLLTETRLSLDESSAAVRRLQEAEAASTEQHKQKVLQLEEQHRQTLEQLTKQHQHEMDLAFEKHRKEMSQFAEDQQTQREALSRAHSAEVEQLEGEWRNKLDVQHEKHLCAVQELNTQHTHKLRELESSRRAREHELQEANFRLLQDQEALKIQSKKLEETLLNDTDHRLQAVRKMCSSLKSEVDSLKTVVEMKNAEIHDLRGQVVEMERLSSELEAARDRAKALQAKTEDLQAQMEKKALQERHLVNEHRLLVEIYQKESNANKRLSLENEELAWKLRQREEIMSTSMPSSTLDLVSRSPATPRRQEGAPSPQAAPRSPRVAVRSPSGKISPSKCDISKRRSRLGLTSEDGVDGDSRVQELSFESPPPSPCVKAVVEKSNSVSFILDLNDSQSDDSFLDLPPSPRPRPQRTVSLSAADRPRTPTHVRRVIHNNRANSLNRNGLHVDVKPKDMNGKPKEVNGKAKEVNEKPKEVNGKSLDTSGQGSRPGSRRTTSESSEGGSEMERVSPTGLAWTVPVHQPKSPVKINASRQNGSPVRDRIEHHLLEDPDEDEYEETPSSTHHFVEVVELSGVGLTSSSEAASDSELSQCDLKGGSSTDSDSDSSDGERHAKQDSSGNQPLGRKNGPWCPKEGAGEAMITDELLKQYTGDPDELLKQYTSDALTVEPLPGRGKRPPRRRLPSAPSSDSDDNNINPHNDGNNMDVSWSEDVDITSSSEMHEL
ncbi:uncharacterized protein [Panulirus ornatus]|uniref:uncharacterized protein isoform X3 n=1 Tax=Panulirus ornatus TaxID=150431 RepID=UPI003A842607